MNYLLGNKAKLIVNYSQGRIINRESFLCYNLTPSFSPENMSNL